MRFLYLFFIGHYYGELLKAKDLIPFMLSDEYWAQGALSKGSSNLGHKFLNAFKVSSTADILSLICLFVEIFQSKRYVDSS